MENFEALSNELVLRSLGSFLSPGDLKNCRLVSKTFDKSVRGLKKWKERMQLHLTRRGDVWGPPGFRLVEDSPSFEAVRLTLSVGQDAAGAAEGAQDAARRAQGAQETNVVQDWSKVFKTVKCLTLEFDPREMEMNDIDLEKLEPLGRTLAFVFAHCTSALVTLIIDRNVLATVNLSTILNTASGLERIRGLRRLEVTEGQGKREIRITIGTFMEVTNIMRQMMTFDSSTQFLGNGTTALEELSMGRFEDNYLDRSLMDLLTPKVNVLRKLEIGEIDAVNVEGVSDLVFPNLTHLSLRISECDANLRSFLGKQPDLQSLTLKIRGFLSQNLLTVIKARSSNLAALNLKCWNMDEREDWSFLTSLEKLREFSFTAPTNFYDRDIAVIDYVEDFFAAMPKGLRKISIRSGLANRVTTRHRMLETLRSHASNFKELEELSIVFLVFELEDDDDRNDEFLRFIGTKTEEDGMFPFPKLRKLHLSHVTMCDEDGNLLGENAFWAGLEDVSIRNVRDVSEDSLTEKLSGTQIRRLSLRGISDLFQISKEGVQMIVENSKCLEALTSNHPGIEKAHRLKIVRYKDIDDEMDSDSDVEKRAPAESEDSWEDVDDDSDDSDYEDLEDDDDEEDDVPDLDDEEDDVADLDDADNC